MARINLLPWRDWERRRLRQRFLLSLALALVVGIVIIVWAAFMVEGQVSSQQGRNQYLREQVAQLDTKIKAINQLKKTRDELLARMKVIEKLEQSRPLVVRLFDQLTRTVPDSVYISSVTNKGGDLTIEGVAQSPSGVSAYMQNIANSPWLADPNLKVVRTKSDGKVRRSSFTVTTRLMQPQDKKDAGQSGGGS
ncbi:MAG: PilN domain-containing protein [Gammaproteobacteria bacterium]